MAKRHFRITVGGNVNELKIDAVSREFLEYWKDREEDLLEVMEYREEYADDHPEEMLPYYEHWSEADGVCGINSVHEDSDYEVQEVKLHSDIEVVDGELQSKGEVEIWGDDRFELLGESEKIQGNSIGNESKQYWIDADDADKESGKMQRPIIIFNSVDKGLLGYLLVELEDDDFDSKKFQYSTTDTSAGNFVEQWWYDRKPLTLEYEGSTTGKYFETKFGYMDISE